MSALPKQSDLAESVQEFMRCVESTGQPSLWARFKTTRPPVGAKFEVLKYFCVPARFRGKVERTPCFFCSPKSPKYYDGYLVYYPEEDSFRGIGNCCGAEFHGVDFKRQIRNIFETERDVQVSEFLLSALLIVEEYEKVSDVLLNWNREIDKVKHELKTILSESVLKRIVREGATGLLAVYERILVPTAGRESHKWESVKTGEFRFVGSHFLQSTRSGESWAQNALTAFRTLPKTDDEIQEALITWSQTLGKCAAMKEEMLKAVDDVREAHKFATSAREFFSDDCFLSLGAWASHPGCPIPNLRAGVDIYGRFVISVRGKKQFKYEKRAWITEPLPALPPFA